jgi:hypothetical protein
MNLSEFRKKVNESNNFELLNNLDFYYINQNQTVNGVTFHFDKLSSRQVK